VLRTAHKRGLLIAGVAATVLAAAGVALILHPDSQVVGSVVARPLSWMPPLVAASVIVGISWILLSQRRPSDEGDTSFTHTRCSSCQREVLGKWRMCPYCGSMLDGSPASAVAGPGSSD
jgi:hypothetical protein